MNDSMGQVQPSTLVLQQQRVVDTLSPAVPPLPHHRQQRPRVREVSSRFMSPLVSSSSSSPGDLLHHHHRHHLPKSPLPKQHDAASSTPEVQSRQQQQQQQQQHRSKSVQRQRCQEQAEPLSTLAEDENIPDTTRSLESPLGNLHIKASVQRNKRTSVAAAVKLFKENNGGRAELSDVLQSRSLVSSGKFLARGAGNVTPSSSRTDTPTVSTTGADRIVSSRFRLVGIPKTNITGTGVTAAAKLLQSIGMSSLSAQPPNLDLPSNGNKDTSKGTDSSTSSNPPSSVGENYVMQANRLRSSLPEVDVLPGLSTRLLADRISTLGNSSKFSASPFSRSLNLSGSSCEHSSLLHTVKPTGERTNKNLANSVKIGSLSLPPVPCPKHGSDSRRGRKDSSHQEEVHSLKLLHNHYLQWRYANAKAEASTHAQRRETERELYTLEVKISNLRDAVKRKRIELGQLKQAKTLSTILEAHMSYLDEWHTVEGEYSSCLSGAIHALLNASLQLPVCGDVQADVREVSEALNSALKMAETICSHIQSFMPKAEEMDALISELARAIGGERALVQECGHLLFKTYASQVEECSLRGHLIQLHCSNHRQA